MVKPLFDFLNARVEADKQKHIVDAKAIENISGGGMAAQVEADKLRAQVRISEGKWGPTVIFMLIVLAPFVWHLWQVCLDSSRFIPAIELAWGFIPYPTVIEHYPGTWKVPALPEPFATTAQAIFTSLFIGASAAIGAVAAINAIKK